MVCTKVCIWRDLAQLSGGLSLLSAWRGAAGNDDVLEKVSLEMTLGPRDWAGGGRGRGATKKRRHGGRLSCVGDAAGADGDGQTDRRTDGQTDRRADGQTDIDLPPR